MVKRIGERRRRKVVLGEDAASTIPQQLRVEFLILLPGQGQNRHFGDGDQFLHCFPTAGIRQVEIGKNHVHGMFTKQSKPLGDAFSMNELNLRIAEFRNEFAKQENVQRVVFDQQEANGFVIVHYGGKVTFLNQNVSIVRTISLNLLKSTGFAR